MTDPIADMLNRIRNAQAVLAETVLVPYSNIKFEIAKILEKNGFIIKVDKKGRKEKFLEIFLKYHQEELERQKKTPVISGLKRISKSGKRVYRASDDIKMTRGRGIAIVSTPSGLMTNKETKQKHLGGEVICEIW